MSSVGRISLDLNVNSKKFNKQVDEIQKQTTKAFNILSVAVGNIVSNMVTQALGSVGEFVKGTLDKGSELSELQNVVDSVFTTMADKVESFSQSALENFGLTEAQSKRMVGTYGAMAKSFGYTENQAYSMSTALTGLTADVASFYNLSHDEAYTKMKSVFTGETESLKELGVVMTQAALDQFALERGVGKTVAQMNEQEKVALRLAFVQDKLSVASGDFLKTQDQWANQTRILKGQFESLQATLGQGFINVLTPALRALNTLMAKLIQVASVFKSFTESIAGRQSSGAGAAMAEVAGAAAEAATSTEGVESAANGAAGAAKKAQKSLMGFDEINKLSKNDTSSGSGSGSMASSIMVPAIADVSISEGSDAQIGGFAQKIVDAIKKINLEPLKQSFENLKSRVMPVLDTIGQAAGWFIDNILVPLSTWVIEDAIPSFFDLLSGIFAVLNPLLVSLQPSLTWLWDNFLSPIASWTGGVITTVLSTLGDLLTSIGTWMSNNQSVVDKITTSVVAFFAAWKGVELMSFIQQSGGVITALKNILKSTVALTAAKVADKAETIYLNLLYAKDFVKSIVTGTAALVKQAAQFAITTGAKVASTAATIASTAATGAATVATWAFNAALAVLTSPITLVIVAIAALIAGIVLLVKNFDTVKAVAEKVFTAIGNIVKKVINGILVGIETFINGVVNGFNRMIDALNRLSFDVPDWVPVIGGGTFGFDIDRLSNVSLPRLAEGGYVRANQPQPVIVGDNKRHGEIISPEDKMRDVMLQALEQFFSRLKDIGYSSNNNGEVGDIIIPIYLDGSMLDEVIVTAQQRRNLRSGGK